MKRYAADFETRAGEEAQREQKTWVWAWSICDITNVDEVKTGNTIADFFDYIKMLGSCDIYFRNLSGFDGYFIIDYLLKNGYVECDKVKHKYDMSLLLTEDNVLYNIRCCPKYRTVINFLDSQHLVPGTIKALGESFKTKYRKLTLDYVLDRPEIYEMTEEEREYVKNDVRVDGEVLCKFFELVDLGKMTIASSAMSYYKAMFPVTGFRKIFPVLDDDIDDFCRKAYRGGISWCKEKQKHLKGVHGYTYDKNSMYPSMMHSSSGNLFPDGVPQYFSGKYEEDPDYPLYIAHVKAVFKVKKNHMPFLQLKNNFSFSKSEFIEDSGEDPIDLWLCDVDMRLFFEQYDVDYIEYIDGYKFLGATGLFDDYIDTWYEIKRTAPKGARRQVAKLFLNSFYGKFAMRRTSIKKRVYLGDDGVVVREVVLEEYEDEEGNIVARPKVENINPVYVPVAVYTTAYARTDLIRAIQANWENFWYCDTDSIHLTAPAVGLTIHPSDLGAWDCESEWVEAVFSHQKTYIEISDYQVFDYNWDDDDQRGKIDSMMTFRCAGMSDRAKGMFFKAMQRGEMTLDDFRPGLKLVGGNLKRKIVQGGILLVPQDYEMKER